MFMGKKVVQVIYNNPMYIAIVVSVVCGFLLTRLPGFSNSVSIEEDTITTGRTSPFIHERDLIQWPMRVPAVLSELRLPLWRMNNDEAPPFWTYIPSGRSDSRDGLIYAFVTECRGTQESGSDPGSIVGLSIAKSLLNASWLAKDVYIVFVPRCANVTHDIDRWFQNFIRSASNFVEDRPLIRGAVVVDLDTEETMGTTELSVEGRDGSVPNQDFANVLLEVGKELNIGINVKDVYNAVLESAGVQGNYSMHTPFMDYNIPSFTLTANVTKRTMKTSVLQFSQLVSKHLRALSGLHHQLHHSTTWYFYSGVGRDISLAVFIPVLLGFMCPLFVSILHPKRNNEPIELGIIFLALAISGPLIFLMASSFAVRMSEAIGNWPPTLGGISAVGLLIFAPVLHIVAARVIFSTSNVQNDGMWSFLFP